MLKNNSVQEVKRSMFQIENTKSPGPDGFDSGFYKAAWPFLKNDVTNAVLEFPHNSKILRKINSTTITLIPKKLRCLKLKYNIYQSSIAMTFISEYKN